LPYFPTQKTHADLQKICSLRRKTSSDGSVLFLGTFGNPPTASAMLQTINQYKRRQRDFEIVLAGFGTERILKQVDLPFGVRVAGQVSDEELVRLLATCRFALAHQSSGTGALTKLAEFLVADVPVIATRVAARGFERVAGITVVDDLEDAFTAVESPVAQGGVSWNVYEKEVKDRGASLIALYERHYEEWSN
jgi:glycosyltransferase involved in cell wall biosynthesis